MQTTLDEETGAMPECKFCLIVKRSSEATIVFEDDTSIVFLDRRPLFPGHCLVVPLQHYQTLADLPASLVGRYFECVKLVSMAVERGMIAQGTFVAINNRISQSVPHLHVHVVPRRMKDGLKGFFWPRHRYESSGEELKVRDVIRSEIEKLKTE